MEWVIATVAIVAILAALEGWHHYVEHRWPNKHK